MSLSLKQPIRAGFEWTDAEVTEGLTLRLAASPAGLCAIQFRPGSFREEERNDEAPLLQETARQLGAYFAGRLTIFDLPLDMMGTPFELRVWNELLRIPYGETRTYAQVAEAIGSPKAVRAVGAANGANPIAIVAPCHRVIGASGKLVGYGGGLELKRRLLELERPSLFRAQV